MSAVDNARLEETISLLQESFQEVAWRSQRLREWLGLERIYKNLNQNFIRYLELVEEVTEKKDDIAVIEIKKRLKRAWSSWRETDMVELEGVSKSAMFITQVIEAAGPVSPLSANNSTLHCVNLKDLLDLCPLIEAAQDELAFETLNKLSTQFKNILTSQIIDRQNSMMSEINFLIEMAMKLTK